MRGPLGSGRQALALVIILAAAWTLPASAQSFPNGAVKIIVPLPAGGVVDLLGRMLAQGLAERWGQSVIVENRVGGSTAVGAAAVERSAPDGHTLLVTADATFTANPLLIEKLPYSPKNFTPIAMAASLTPVLAVNKTLPVNNVRELVAYARSKPGVLNYASFGIGSFSHLGMEDLKQRARVEIAHVPFTGSGPALFAIVRGDVSLLLVNLAAIEPQESTGDVRIIAAAGEVRAATRPQLPTVDESGISGFAISAWFGLFGPASMPSDIASKIHDDVAKVLEMPAAEEMFRVQSLRSVSMSSAEVGALVERDSAHWGKLIKSLGIKAN
jgi:tripartite-type tricarboxylate transporter receptor subunit TctC